MQGKKGLILKYAAFSTLAIKRRRILEKALVYVSSAYVFQTKPLFPEPECILYPPLGGDANDPFSNSLCAPI